ncbi:DUF6615 family protein [Nocardia farcinica]|uniref:DUF6615 family protein n=1 Tax=Nocardia farcinica TaxID=37329 RepID=UPI002454E69C|nr:DUF6615 family protein [Nocardia farcinica]
MEFDRINELCKGMDRLARQTWKNYELGSEVGLVPGEESTTDSVLLDLWRVSSDILHVNKFTRHQEQRNGADWEWWVGSDTDGWLRLRIQAKRIYEQNYERLDHRDKKTRVFQYDTLIQGCAQDSYTYPVHVFYNGWPNTRFGRTTPTEDLVALTQNQWWKGRFRRRANWGITALSSYDVGRLFSGGGSYAPRYLEHAMPWSELFRAGTEAQSKPWKTPLNHIHQRLSQITIAAADSYPNAPQIPSIYNARPRPDLPMYAQAVRNGEAAAFNEVLFDAQEALPPNPYVAVLDLSEVTQPTSTASISDAEIWR